MTPFAEPCKYDFVASAERARARAWETKRAQPYTERGIKRLKCISCRCVATVQWQVCADGNNYRPLCVACDVLLNRLVLAFMQHPHAEQKTEHYAKSRGYDGCVFPSSRVRPMLDATTEIYRKAMLDDLPKQWEVPPLDFTGEKNDKR